MKKKAGNFKKLLFGFLAGVFFLFPVLSLKTRAMECNSTDQKITYQRTLKQLFVDMKFSNQNSQNNFLANVKNICKKRVQFNSDEDLLNPSEKLYGSDVVSPEGKPEPIEQSEGYEIYDSANNLTQMVFRFGGSGVNGDYDYVLVLAQKADNLWKVTDSISTETYKTSGNTGGPYVSFFKQNDNFFVSALNMEDFFELKKKVFTPGFHTIASTGYYEFCDVFLVAHGKFKKVLSYPHTGLRLSPRSSYDVDFKSEMKCKEVDHLPSLQLSTSVEYSGGGCGDASTSASEENEGDARLYIGGALFSRIFKITYLWNEQKNSFDQDKLNSNVDAAELKSSLFAEDSKDFFLGNYSDFEKLAKSKDEDLRGWLRCFLQDVEIRKDAPKQREKLLKLISGN